MIRALLLGCGLALAAPAAAQDGDWPAIVPGSEATPGDVARMAADFPHGGSLQLRLIQAALESGDDEAARAAFRRFVEMGGVLSERGMGAVAPVFEPPELAELRARMAANAAPIARSRRAGRASPGMGLVEGIVHLPNDDALAVSSVTGRMIHVRRADRWEPYVAGPMRYSATGAEAGSLMGLAVDPQRGWLWVASAVIEQTPEPASAFAGLIGIAPGRNEVLWLPVPEGGQPGDVTVGPDGAVYLSDGATGAIHVRAIGDVELRRLVAPGRLRNPQGMAVSPDGSALIVADYNYGLARLDLETGALDRLLHDGPGMLDGIDGLQRHGDALIAIRNGVAPYAILRIAIDPSGRQVHDVEILERAHPDWGEPTLGAIHENTLYYVADARWGDFGSGGRLDRGAAPRPTTIRALPLDPGR